MTDLAVVQTVVRVVMGVLTWARNGVELTGTMGLVPVVKIVTENGLKFVKKCKFSSSDSFFPSEYIFFI